MGVTFTVNGIAAEGSYDTIKGGSTRLTLAVTATPDPHTFSGTATLDGAPATGSPAPADLDSLEGESGAAATGAAIAAMAEGQDSVSATSDPSDGTWSLEVPGDTSGWTFTAMGSPVGGGPYDAPAGEATPDIALPLVTVHTFSGTATVDGDPAAGGLIVAMVGDETVGTTTADDAGAWSLTVAGGQAGVTFTVNRMAAEAGPYEAVAGGSATDIVLAVTTPEPATDDDEAGTDDGSMMQDESGDDGTADGSTDGDADEGDADDGAASGMAMPANLGDPPSADEPTGTPDGTMGTGDDSLDNGDDTAMDSDGAMDDGDEGAMDEGVNQFPDTGTGGLADSSRGVSSAVYGGIAGALALIALAGGVAVRRRAQS